MQHEGTVIYFDFIHYTFEADWHYQDEALIMRTLYSNRLTSVNHLFCI